MPLRASDIFGSPEPADLTSYEMAELISERFSDDNLALRFTREYADRLRYTAAWGQWHWWDGCRWTEDSTLDVFHRVREICRAATAECNPEKEKQLKAHLLESSTTADVERMARYDRRHAATVEQWDADPWALNTPKGVIDLRTGALRPANPIDYLTKVTACAPAPQIPELWFKFLLRITGEDVQLCQYLQRVIGYCLTGVTREHALFFLHGSGANGKSVFMTTISNIMGAYCTNAPLGTFTVSRNEQHPTDLAGLRGARLVKSIEIEDGARWAEAKVKALTGGDAISARFMRQDFFEYTPQFKLLVAGNHRPGLRSVDEAIRRRLHLIPFNTTIPPDERDPELADKLKAEYPGILAWAIEGCGHWQREGLNPPAAVTEATKQYLEAEDAVGRWLDERCVIGRQHWTASSTLYADYKEWCDRAGEYCNPQKRFVQALEVRDFEWQRTKTARGFIGLALRNDSGANGDGR